MFGRLLGRRATPANDPAVLHRRPAGGSVDLWLVHNAEACHTTAYETSEWKGMYANALIVRRAARILLDVSSPNGADVATATLSLTLTCFSPLPPKYELPLVTTPHGVEVSLPAAMAIGAYDGQVRFKSGDVIDCPAPIVVLANAFAEEDDVYMPQPAERDEYVLEETGMIWNGSSSHMGRIYWDYGQFDEGVLQAALAMLQLHRKLDTSDPVAVSRWLSCIVNASNRLDAETARRLGIATFSGALPGVLVGKWPSPSEFAGGRDPYAGGTPPTEWNGSAPILLEWLSHLSLRPDGTVTSYSPVLYGQCWVFGGVLTTLSRALGIPARTVTNFDSAHDTTLNRMLDYVYPVTADGDVDFASNRSHDSIWNFHVWNDLWFRRNDLADAGAGGWQACDATPQEKSGGLYRCGPASVALVKRGERADFDLDFVIAEVNADARTVLVPTDAGTGELDYSAAFVSRVDTRQCGQLISTKAVGRFERHDVTSEYKYAEGSAAERASLLFGQRESGLLTALSRHGQAVPPDAFSLRLDGGSFEVGQPFGMRLTCSAGVGGGTWRCSLMISAISYDGGKATLIKQSTKVMLQHGQSAELQVSADDYAAFLHEATFPFELRASAVNTDKPRQVWTSSKVVGLQKLELEMEVPPTRAAWEAAADGAAVRVRFVNPLSIALTNGVLHLQTSRFRSIKQEVGTIAAHGTLDVSVPISKAPRASSRVRSKTFVAALVTTEVAGIGGHATIDMTDGDAPSAPLPGDTNAAITRSMSGRI